MTLTEPAIQPAIEPTRTAGEHRRPGMFRRHVGRPSLRGVAVLVVLVFMTGGIGAYFERVLSHAPAAIYPVAAPAQTWLQAADPAPVSWFRAEVDLPAAPTSGVLTIDARDMYRVWVNGRVAATNREPARLGTLPTGDAVDVRPMLTSGRNVIAVQVNGLGEEPAALWARLQVKSSSPGGVDLNTDSGQWLATSNAALTGSRLGLQPEFIEAGYPMTRWAAPTRLAPVREVTAPVPDLLMATPGLTAVSVRGFDASYAMTATVAESTTDGWLQIAATGALTVSVNGELIASEPAPGYVSPNSHRAAPLFVIPLAGRLHGGSNQLFFHVTGNNATAVAVGVFARSGTGAWQPITPAEQDWTIRAQGAAMAATPLSASATAAIWPNGFNASDASDSVVAAGWLSVLSSILPAWVLAMLVLLGLAVCLRVPTRTALGRIVLCLAPGLTLIVASLAYGRWITTTPGFPYSAPVAGGVIVVLLVPLLGLPVLALFRPGRRVRLRASNLRLPPGVQPPAAAGSLGLARAWQRATARLPFASAPQQAVIVVIAALAGVAQGWRIGRQPLWQDEVTSIVVARTIAHQGLPRLDSGLFYFKAELYHGLLALVLDITDNPDVLRLLTLFWFVGTVLVFGLLLMPTLTSSRALQALATAVFVLVPAEVAWARDVRMYQQMQFFAVVFLALFIRALRTGRTRDIVLSAITLLAMYLSHEESFVMLPALPLMALVARQVVWARRRVFLAAFLPVGLVIAGQYTVSHIHPPDFGEDLSNRPYVGLDPNQADFYYQKIFFAPLAHGGSLAVVSALAVVAILLGLHRRQTATTLAALALVGTVTAISLVLTAKVDRYSFVTIPLLIALAVLGASGLVSRLSTWRAGLTHTDDRRPVGGWLRGTVVATVAFAVIAVLATLVVSPRGFGLWAADLTNTPNPLAHPDYAATTAYLREHQRPGDQIITLAPPVMTAQYLGKKPDRVIQTGRNKLLYLVLRNGQAVETILGVPVLLTGEQIRVFLEAHARVWLVSDAGSYIQGVPPDVRTEVSKDFKIVAQDSATTVSLWDAG